MAKVVKSCQKEGQLKSQNSQKLSILAVKVTQVGNMLQISSSSTQNFNNRNKMKHIRTVPCEKMKFILFNISPFTILQTIQYLNDTATN